eukprot:4555715-Prymnesium_polylepis.1
MGASLHDSTHVFRRPMRALLSIPAPKRSQYYKGSAPRPVKPRHAYRPRGFEAAERVPAARASASSKRIICPDAPFTSDCAVPA